MSGKKELDILIYYEAFEIILGGANEYLYANTLDIMNVKILIYFFHFGKKFIKENVCSLFHILYGKDSIIKIHKLILFYCRIFIPKKQLQYISKVIPSTSLSVYGLVEMY